MPDPKMRPPQSWGHSVVDTACPLDCPDACSLAVTVEGGRVRSINGSRTAPSTQGFICSKVRHFDRRIYSELRIQHPAVRKGAKGRADFERVSWNEALDLIAAKMQTAAAEYGPESVLPFYYGGSNGLLTNELTDARLFRRFGASRLARTVCAAPTGAAASALYGKMAGVAYEDYPLAKTIIVWGANPQATGIHLVPFLKQAQQNGARLIVIDPRRTPLARQADLHLLVRPGTDVVLALSMIRECFAGGHTNNAFLREHATGVEELRAIAEPWSFTRAAEVTGVREDDIRMAFRLYVNASPAVIRCGWGQERNRNGGAATMAILALPAIAGKFGVRGGGYTMSNSAAYGIKAETLVNVPAPPTRVINMNRLGRALTEVRDPKIAVLFSYNCNPLATMPDQNRVREGLEREDLFTVVFDQVMTDTAAYADVILPATTFFEHYDITKGYGAYHLHLTRPVIDAVGEARPNHEVFHDLGARLGLWDSDADDLGESGALLEAASRLTDAARAALLEGGPAPIPGDGRPVQFVDVFPNTADKRVHLCPADLVTTSGAYVFQADPATATHPLALISPASEKTVSSTCGEQRPGIVSLKMHPDDARPREIEDGDQIRVFNELGEVHCLASITPEVRPGVVAMPKGLWTISTFNNQTGNALVPDTLADLDGGACFNDARVDVALLGRH